MENKLDHPQSHEEREVQTLVKRIEKQVSQESAREAETKRTFDDYRKKSAASPSKRTTDVTAQECTHSIDASTRKMVNTVYDSL